MARQVEQMREKGIQGRGGGGEGAEKREGRAVGQIVLGVVDAVEEEAAGDACLLLEVEGPVQVERLASS